MKSVKISVYFLALVVITFTGCRKEDVSSFTEGTYVGKFIFSSSLGIIYTHTETPAYITFDKGNYTADLIIPNANSVPGKGSYTLKADTAIDFRSSFPIQVMIYPTPAHLNAIYKREYKGDSLILTLNIPSILTTYQYRLKRN
jgi:hypothetical protein